MFSKINSVKAHSMWLYSFCSKILLSQNWTGSDILESLDISVNITQQIYYDGYRRVNM